ncbi:MAG: hypothetical protein PHQ15_02920 [Methanosarcina sp.]|nr:hypothetical protein [Methanosarcina sp.]MDD4619765.1 hypothetical protein [Methanosarcina sp.]
MSAGSVGSPDGYTALVVRTLVGQHLLESAVVNGKLSVGGEVGLGIIEKLAKKKMARKSNNYFKKQLLDGAWLHLFFRNPVFRRGILQY